jgi:hypothetical protein
MQCRAARGGRDCDSQTFSASSQKQTVSFAPRPPRNMIIKRLALWLRKVFRRKIVH